MGSDYPKIKNNLRTMTRQAEFKDPKNLQGSEIDQIN